MLRPTAAAITALVLLALGQPATAAVPRSTTLGASCQDSWVNAAGGTWTSGANWSLGAPPTAGQAACVAIPLSAPAVLNTTTSIGSLTVGGPAGAATLELSSSLTLSSSSRVAPNGTLLGQAGVLTVGSGAALTNDGAIDVTGGWQVAGALTNAPDGAMSVDSSQTLGLLGGELTNDGELVVQTNATLTAPAGGATGSVIDDDGGEVVNQGTVDVHDGATFEQGDGALVGNAAQLAYPDPGTLELTGDGPGSFSLAGGSALTGDVASGQRLVIGGATTVTGSLTNAGAIVGGSGGQTLTLTSGTLTNTGSIEVPPGNSLSVAGDVLNASSGTIALNGSTLLMSGAATLTNDGSVLVAPNSTLGTGAAGTIDNDGGSIANGGTVSVPSGGTFVEGDGTTSGNPVDVSEGTLSITGTGASSFQLYNGPTIEGDVAAGQVIRQMSGVTALASFTNAGTWIGDGGGALALPTGGTMTNAGTLEIGHGGSGSGGMTIAGNLTNASSGVIGEGGGSLSFASENTTFDNEGTLDLLFSNALRLSGTGNCGGSGQPACDIDWVNHGTVYWGVDSTGSSWGGFGLASQFGGATGDVVTLGGTIIPVPLGEPTMPSTPPAQPAISYGIGSNTEPPGTTTPTWTVTCPAAVTGGWSLSCPDTTQLWEYDYGSGQTLAPTMVGVASTGTTGSFGWTTTYGAPETLTATVSAQDGSTPTGTVTFYAPEQNTQGSDPIAADLLGTSTITTTDGVSTATLVTNLPPGQYEVLGLYSGDATHLAASNQYGDTPTSDPEGGSLTVAAQPTTASIAASASTSPAGAPVTLTATVTPGMVGPSEPGGVVTFLDGGVPLGTAPVATTSGVTTASFTTSDLAVGSNAITATYGGDADYVGATSSSTGVTVTAVAAQAVTLAVPAGGTVGGSATLSPTSSSGLPVALSVDASTVPAGGCTLSGPTSGVFTVQFVHAGTCVLDASQAGDAATAPAPQNQESITVAPASQTVAFTSTAPTTATVGTTPYAPTAAASSGLAAAITLDAGSSGCTLVSGEVRFVAAGTCVLDANQAGDADFLAALQVSQSIDVLKAPNSISVSSSPPSSPEVGGTYTPVASATSGDAVVVTLGSGSTGCSLGGGVVHLTSAGTCVVDFNDPGNAGYVAAAQVTQTFTVGKRPNEITVTSTPPAHPAVGGTYVPAAHATSTDAVVVTLGSGSTGCSLGGGVVRFVAVGPCLVRFDDPGNATYAAAATVLQSLSVAKGSVTLTASASPAKASSAKHVVLGARLSTKAAAGTVTFREHKVLLCTATVAAGVASCKVTRSLPAGTYKVTATYSGSASYLAASATTSFKVT